MKETGAWLCKPHQRTVPLQADFGKIIFLLLFALFCTLPLHAETPTQRVGLPLLLEDLYLTGPLTEPVPRKDREVPLIVRLVETKPAQDGFRYTFEVQGLDPGSYNLGDYLRPTATESGTSSHFIPLIITTGLPPGLPQPAALQPKPAPRIGGYRALLFILGLVWIAGLTWLFFSSRKRKESHQTEVPPPTLADRLEPILKKASQGQLATEEQAQLERLILAHWRKRVPEVTDLPPAKSLALLRDHPEASPLLRKLEHWLHAPASEVSSSEIDTLLEPYRT
ncbi:MAG: hypothetical protein ACSHYB_04255 [Roseibacillus sp.]